MENENLLEEIKSYSDEDLRLIFETQKDLYTPEEMSLIEKELYDREGKKQPEKTVKLPEKLICPKCDGENPTGSKKCQFCGWSFDERKLSEGNWEEEKTDSDSKSLENNGNGESHAFHYVISFLVPLIGFILGAVLLGKDDTKQQSIGKTCIIIGIVSIVLVSVVFMMIVL